MSWDSRRFADCNGALLFAGAQAAVGLYQYRLRGHLDHATIRRVPGLGYRGTGRVVYAIDPASSVMSLPRWSWPGMTRAQRAAMGAFVAALRNHELGHREIAERALARTSTITVISPTLAGAKRDLRRALAAQLQEQHAETTQAEKTYDRVTDHGIHQSEAATYGFRPGPNVVFSCN